MNFIPQKTDGIEMMPISEQAYHLLDERKEPKIRFLKGLFILHGVNLHLTKWLFKAGITKDITFHCQAYVCHLATKQGNRYTLFQKC